ncbi:MAG TPA: 8-amino-7-oxononanoate synthase [Methylophilaceae bacterium]|nr:8-amino-7-oxononanoate synthase [Methylophilaceae bacterium]
MADHLLSALQQSLSQREADGLLRKRRLLESAQGPHSKVDGRDVLSFCSNDYLGLANHADLQSALQEGVKSAGMGSGASHLLTGHHRYHHALEEALAKFVDLPAALLFSTGYMANLAAISGLMDRNDALFADKLNHASLNDGALLSRATLHRYPHGDWEVLERLLASSAAPRKMVITDSVFSMDGDIAPLKDLVEVCKRHDAWLLIDDAHGFGVLGQQGQGCLNHFNLKSPHIIYMATLGKAAGVSGAFIAGERVVIDYLIQNARTYIYTTAMPPALAAASLQSVKLIGASHDKRAHLHELIAHLQFRLRLKRWQLMDSATPIQPLVIGSNDEAVLVSEHLLEDGILVPAIRPPTVPKGSARLRISLSAAHTVVDVERLAQALEHAEERLTA